MVGPTAQLVALACHYNGRIRRLQPVPFYPSNSTCNFCEQVHFVHQRRAWFGHRDKWAIAAQTPDEWLEREVCPGKKALVVCQRINDPRILDRNSAGFVGGGGRWYLKITDDQRMNVWEATWEVGNREAPDRRIWRVQYSQVAEKLTLVLPTHRSPAEIIPVLVQALSDVLIFSEQHHLDGFSINFRKAIECLSADDPLSLVYHKDLAPEKLLSLPAEQLLAACQEAWVFGGMGSWNDMAFDGQEQGRYERLSDAVFTLLNEAIQSSVNSAADFEKPIPKDLTEPL